MFPAAVGHDPPDRLRPGRLRLALGAAGLHDQEQAAFRRKERGTDRHLPAHAARDQPDPGTRVRAQRQPQRGLLQIPPRLRHPLRRTQPGTRPPYRRPGTGSASAAIRLAGSIRPAAPASKPGAARLVRWEASRSFLEPYYQTYIFFYDCYEVFSGSSRPANNRKIYRDSLRRHLGIPASNSETREQTEQRLLERLGQSRPGAPSMPRRPIPGDHYRAHGDDWLAKKYYTLSAIARPSKTPRRKTARSSPWRNSTSITRIIRGPTNTPSRPSRTPFAATCSSGSCG